MSTLERVQSALAGLECQVAAGRDGIPVVTLSARQLREAVRRLRDAAGFDTSTFVTALDRYPAEPRFELAWQFLSSAHSDRVRLHAPAGGEEPRAPTITDYFPGAAYGERECFDMFGIVFDGHPGLKRLLMPEAYEYFPLRKDFPHQGIEPDRLYREWDRRRRERPENRNLPHAPEQG